MRPASRNPSGDDANSKPLGKGHDAAQPKVMFVGCDSWPASRGLGAACLRACVFACYGRNCGSYATLQCFHAGLGSFVAKVRCAHGCCLHDSFDGTPHRGCVLTTLLENAS